MNDISQAQVRQPSSHAALPQAMADRPRPWKRRWTQVLPQPHGLHARVHEAMRYAIFAGGKRLRPFLVLHSAAMFGVAPARAARAAAAIEVLHTYSLVHDDLPCMDDDDLRRGRPTTHKAFDEATAVLAGDALLTIAFEILADAATHPIADVRAEADHAPRRSIRQQRHDRRTDDRHARARRVRSAPTRSCCCNG